MLSSLLFATAAAQDFMPKAACLPLTGVQSNACARLEQILSMYPDQCSISTWLLPHCEVCGECENSNRLGSSDDVWFDPAFDWSEPAGRGVDVLEHFNDEGDDINWDSDLIQKIIGGQTANRGQFPYFTDLLEEWNGRWERVTCGASLIHDDAVLTAAHCIDSTSARMEVIVGAYDHSDRQTYRDNGGQRFARVRSSRITVHSGYNPRTTQNDIAIIHLQGSATDGGRIVPIRIARRDMSAGTTMTVIGMGLTSEGGRLSRQLRHVSYPTISLSECQRLYNAFGERVTSDMLCAYRVGGGVDACQGDSGGPLVRGNTQYGVVSWGIGCAGRGAPGVYARVAAFNSWIRSTVSGRTNFGRGFLFSY
jgi:trypsin